MTEPEKAERADAQTEESGSRSPRESGASVDVAASMDAPTEQENQSLLSQLTVGTVIDGKYQIDAVIGRGAMGVVVAATHVHLKERTALKFLNARAQGADDSHSRFRREARVSAKLRNEHITRVIDVGVWRDKVPYMVMDHLVGTDLRRTIKSGGPLSLATALDYIVQICEGLAEAHAIGIVHRDLKPSNLFVTKRSDGSDLIKILDFGISKWDASEHEVDELTQTGVILGSPKYMAPEQLFGSAAVDPRADIWSVGAIFYEMLVGKPPFDFPTLTRICAELASDRMPPSLVAQVPGLPPAVEAAVFQCFVREREHRVQNVAELAGSLLDAVDAPFASHVRNKIAAVLDPQGTGAALGASSGALTMGTGSYTGTGSVPPSGARRAAALGGTLSTGGAARAAPAEGSGGRKKTLVIVGVVASLAVIAAVAFAMGSRSAGEAKSPESAPASSAPSAAALVSPAPAPAPTLVAPPASAPTATSQDPKGGTAPTVHVPIGHHPIHAVAPPKVAPAPPAAAAPAPAPPPAPAPAPTPAPAAKTNPLEDRQ